MAITDIVTHVEVASQSGHHEPTFDPAAERSRPETDGYRRALSRSLNNRRETASPGEKQPEQPAAPPATQANHSEAARDNAPSAKGSVSEDSGQPLDTQQSDAQESAIAAQIIVQPPESREPTPEVIPLVETIDPADVPSDGANGTTHDETGAAFSSTLELVASDPAPGPPANFQVTYETVGPPSEASASGTIDVDTDAEPHPPGNLFRVEQYQTAPPATTIATGEQQPAAPLPPAPVERPVNSDAPLSAPQEIGDDSAPQAESSVAPAVIPIRRPSPANSNVPVTHSRQPVVSEAVGEVANSQLAESPESPPTPHILNRPQSEDQAVRAVSRNAANPFTTSTKADVWTTAAGGGSADSPSTAIESLPATAELATVGSRVAADGVVRNTDGSVPVDKTALVDRVAEMIRLGQQNNRPMRMRLHPPELGVLQVEVSSQNGAITARLQVETPMAHKAVLESLPLLQDSLTSHGTVVDRIDVQLSPNLQDSRQPDFHRQGEGEQDGSSRERQQRDTQQQRRQNQRQSEDKGRQQDMDEIDIEI